MDTYTRYEEELMKLNFTAVVLKIATLRNYISNFTNICD